MIYLHHIRGFHYRGYLYSWDYQHGVFMAHPNIPDTLPTELKEIPNDAYNIKLVIYEDN